MNTPPQLGPRVLVVDDDVSVGLAVTRQLTQLGCRASYMQDARGVAAALQRDGYDLLVCDVVMPEMEGTDVVAQLRSNGIETAVILITGERDATTAIAGFRCGAADVLLKPFGREELRASLRRALGARALTSLEAPPPAVPTPIATAPVATAPPSGTPLPSGTAPEAGSRSLSLKVLQYVSRADALVLPTPPRLVARLAEMAEDDSGDDAELEALIQSHVTLSGAVIRAANSAHVAQGKSATAHVHEAILRLGTGRALHNALLAAQRATYSVQDTAQSAVMGRLWVTHFLTAIIGAELARRTLSAETARTQTLLLFMEAGEVLTLRALVDIAPEVFTATGMTPLGVQTSRDIHASVGEAMLRKWQMPVTFCRAAGTHATPGKGGDDQLGVLMAIGRISRQAAETLVPSTGVSVPHTPSPEDWKLAAGVTQALIEEAGRNAMRQLGVVVGKPVPKSRPAA